MSSNGKAASIMAKVVVALILIALLVAIIGVIIKFTGGLTSDFKTFYVTVNGQDVMTNAGGYTISRDNPLSVETKYLLSSEEGQAKGYTIKVVPNPINGEDFDFTLNGEVYSFQAEPDLTAGFDIEREETAFVISPKGSVKDVLQAVYPSYEISDCEGGYMDMYALIISSYDESQSVTLYFTVPERVLGVTLDKEVIVF